MIDNLDTRRDIAIKIINHELGVIPIEIKRFQNGYCHSVYYIKTKCEELVLRITSKENKEYYLGSIKWLSELNVLGVPVPKLIKHGQYNDIFFTIITYISGKDIGEIYHTLSDFQKRGIVKELVIIQGKIATLPTIGLYGYPYSENNHTYKTWIEYLESFIERSRVRIDQNKIFKVNICDRVKTIMHSFNEYFIRVQPIAFLDDISTKNVLVDEGKFSGIVDIDEICFGDSILVIGLTNIALISMKMDTKYIDYWLEEIDANEVQRKIVIFYSLLYCIDFMSEQGMKFDNGNIVSYNNEKVELLNNIYNELINILA